MRWFTSDQHFGHARIIELCGRPFRDVDDMNQQIIDRWNERVGHDDSVYVLGDFALGKIADTLLLAAQLNGYKLLVPGNHDRCWHGEKRAPRRRDWVQRYRDAGFKEVWDAPRPMPAVLGINSKPLTPVACSHFPYDNDPWDRHELNGFSPIDHGGWLLHGHVHDLYQVKGRQINVGVDAWDFAPVSEDMLLDVIREDPGWVPLNRATPNAIRQPGDRPPIVAE
jgi:calcineurin-like phosphoesterase family protein